MIVKDIVEYRKKHAIILIYEEIPEFEDALIRIVEHPGWELAAAESKRLPPHTQFKMWYDAFDYTHNSWGNTFFGVYYDSESLLKYFRTYNEQLNKSEKDIVEMLKENKYLKNSKNIIKNFPDRFGLIFINKEFCKIEKVPVKSIIKHELAHFLFHVSEKYRKQGKEVYKSLRPGIKLRIREALSSLRYNEFETLDEFTACCIADSKGAIACLFKNFSEKEKEGVQGLRDTFQKLLNYK